MTYCYIFCTCHSFAVNILDNGANIKYETEIRFEARQKRIIIDEDYFFADLEMNLWQTIRLVYIIVPQQQTFRMQR